MPATLFNCRLLEPAADAEPRIVTPLGTLTFDAEFDGIVIGGLKTSSCYRLVPDGYLLNWTLDGIVAELLLCRPRFTLPEGLSVTDCWAAMWRLQATVGAVPSERPAFSCRWEPGYQWTEGSPETGEGLDAQTWENAETIVTVGTVDCEWLSGQAQQGILPHRWADLLGWNYGDEVIGKIDPVTYLKDGIRIVLPEMNAGEMCQVQFVAAWSPNTGDERSDASTWYAADQRPKDILAGAGCED